MKAVQAKVALFSSFPWPMLTLILWVLGDILEQKTEIFVDTNVFSFLIQNLNHAEHFRP